MFLTAQFLPVPSKMVFPLCSLLWSPYITKFDWRGAAETHFSKKLPPIQRIISHDVSVLLRAMSKFISWNVINLRKELIIVVGCTKNAFKSISSRARVGTNILKHALAPTIFCTFCHKTKSTKVNELQSSLVLYKIIRRCEGCFVSEEIIKHERNICKNKWTLKRLALLSPLTRVLLVC